jgi:hypothetical protein
MCPDGDIAPLGERPQDPLVAAVRPTPADPAQLGLTLAGFLGDSHRDGYRRLYFDLGMTSFVEFRVEDVAAESTVPPDSAPFVGEQTTRVTLRLGVRFEYTETRALNTDDFAVEPPTADPGFGLDDGLRGDIVAFGCRFPRTR